VALVDGTRLEVLVLGPIFALASAASAAGSLALARSGSDRNRLDPGTEMDEAGLTDSERRELLGGQE
jgi:hypothetical protein